MSSRDSASADLPVGPPQAQPNPADSLLEKWPLLHPEGEPWISPKFLTPLGARPMAAHNPQVFFPEGIPDLPEVASADFQPTEFFPDSQFQSKASTRAGAPALQRRVEMASPGESELFEPEVLALSSERGSSDFSELLGIEPAASAPVTAEPAAALSQTGAEETPESVPDLRADASVSPEGIQRRVSSASAAPGAFSPEESVSQVASLQGTGPSENFPLSGAANPPQIQAVSPSVGSTELAEQVAEPAELGAIAPPGLQAFTLPAPTTPTPGPRFGPTNPIAPPAFAAEPEFTSPVVSPSGASASPPPLQTRLAPESALEPVTLPDYPATAESAQIPEGVVDQAATEPPTGSGTSLAAVQGPEISPIAAQTTPTLRQRREVSSAAIADPRVEADLPPASPEPRADFPTIAAASSADPALPLVQAQSAPAPEQPPESISSVASNRSSDLEIPAVQRQSTEVATTPVATPGAASDGGIPPDAEPIAPFLEAGATAARQPQAISPRTTPRPDAPEIAPAAIGSSASRPDPATTADRVIQPAPEATAPSVSSLSPLSAPEPTPLAQKAAASNETAAVIEATEPQTPIAQPEVSARSIAPEFDSTETEPVLVLGDSRLASAPAAEAPTPAVEPNIPSDAPGATTVPPSGTALSSPTVSAPTMQTQQELTPSPEQHLPATQPASLPRRANPDAPIASTIATFPDSQAETESEFATTAEDVLSRAVDRVAPSDSALRPPQIQQQNADEILPATSSSLPAAEVSVTADSEVTPTASLASPDTARVSGGLPGIQPKSEANVAPAVIPVPEVSEIASDDVISTASSVPESDETTDELPLIQSKGEAPPVVSMVPANVEGAVVSEVFPVAERAAETGNDLAVQPNSETPGFQPDAPTSSRDASGLLVVPPSERVEAVREQPAVPLRLESNPASAGAAPSDVDELAPAALPSGEVAGDADLPAIQTRLEINAPDSSRGLLSSISEVPDFGDRPGSPASETGTADATPQENPTSALQIPHLSDAIDNLAVLRPLPTSQPLVQRDPIPAAEQTEASQPDAGQTDLEAAVFSPRADQMNPSAARLPRSIAPPTPSPATAVEEPASAALTVAQSTPAEAAIPDDTPPLADAGSDTGPTPPLGQSAASAEPRIQAKTDNPAEGAPVLSRAAPPGQSLSANPTAETTSPSLHSDSSADFSDSIPDQWSSIEDLLTQTRPTVQRRLDNLSDLVPPPASPTTPSGSITAELPPMLMPPTPPSLADGALASPFNLPVTPTTGETATDDSTPEELSGKQASAQEESDNLERLAREIYHLLRQRIEIEQERSGGYYRDRRF